MAHPKRRKSKSKTGMKRAHHAIKPGSLSECPNCRNTKMPHRVCPECGYYKDSTIA
ncbi:50S ribosomal protein L32 [bacterium]|nr:50S ribosomal protein L32 [bacterium]